MKSALDIVCPRCNVAPGDDCLPAGRTHQERFSAAERANELTAGVRSMLDAGARARANTAPEVVSVAAPPVIDEDTADVARPAWLPPVKGQS